MPLTPAPKGYAIKQVRDRTPHIINADGTPGHLWYARTAETTEERLHWLHKKLGEEVTEYLLEPGREELADVLMVLDAILCIGHASSIDEAIKEARKDPRGGFLLGVIMYGRHPEYDR